MHDVANKRRGELATECRALLRLAVPVAIVQLGMMAFGIVDVMMVGRVSKTALAAVALGHTYSFGWMILGMGTLFVMDPVVAQAFGGGDRRAISAAVLRGGTLAVVLAAVIVGVFLLALPVLHRLSDDAAVIEIATDYIQVAAVGVPGLFLFTVLKQVLQAMSIVRPVFVAVAVANVVNVVLNVILIYGKLGFPALGAVGAAWGSSFSRWVLFATLAAAFWIRIGPQWERPERGVFAPGALWRLCVRGVPIGVQMALEVWVFVAVSLTMMSIGVVAIGGHVVAMNLASTSFMIPLGIGAAAATRVGNAIGRRDAAGARLAARASLLIGTIVMLVSASIFYGLPEPLARLYTDDPEVVAMAVLLIPIAGLFQVFDGAQTVACGILRGAGDTRVPAVINLVGYWGLAFPLGMFLTFSLGAGPRGLWWGLTFGLLTCAILLVLWVRRRVGVEASP